MTLGTKYFILSSTDSVRAVSYTHLDVYKRQVRIQNLDFKKEGVSKRIIVAHESVIDSRENVLTVYKM